MSSVGHVNGVKVSRESTSEVMGALPARDVGTDRSRTPSQSRFACIFQAAVFDHVETLSSK